MSRIRRSFMFRKTRRTAGAGVEAGKPAQQARRELFPSLEAYRAAK